MIIRLFFDPYQWISHMRAWSEFAKGVIAENPVLVLLLGCCPVLAVTTGVKNAVGMGAAATFVLVCSNFLVALVKRGVPKEVRIPIYIVIIATFVTVVKLVMAAYLPALKDALGIFLALIVVNCIILGRAEAFASKNGPFLSIMDGLGMGLGFTLALSLIAFFREIFGAGMIFGIPLANGLESYTQKIFILPPGGFLTMGLILFASAWIKNRHDRKQLIRRNLARGRNQRQKEFLVGTVVVSAAHSNPHKGVK